MHVEVAPETVPLAWRGPFSSGAAYRDARPHGETLLEMARSVPDLPEVFFRRGTICINGVPMARDKWHVIRPKPDSADSPKVVTLHLALQGGGGGNGSTKQVVAIVAAIALTVATAGIAAGALGGLTGIAALGAGTIGAQALAAATGVGGGLDVVQLPPPG